jgi:hypothetical protein
MYSIFVSRRHFQARRHRSATNVGAGILKVMAKRCSQDVILSAVCALIQINWLMATIIAVFTRIRNTSLTDVLDVEHRTCGSVEQVRSTHSLHIARRLAHQMDLAPQD